MADFRLCSICKSHSQASFHHSMPEQVSDLSELTFAHLRYFLGGDRPSQTTHHALSESKTREPLPKLQVVFQDCTQSAPTYPTYKFSKSYAKQ